MTASHCTSCGGPLAPNAVSCTQCGAAVADVHAVATDTESRLTAGSITKMVEAEMLAALSDATLGEYEIRGELGRGGMAVVYLAQDLALDRKVAIKVMSPTVMTGPDDVERFRREAKTAAAMSHPHIIPIYVVKETERILFFVMKYVSGTPLDDIIAKLGPLPLPMVTTVMSQVGGALGYAHRHGVIHRDIKPANIIVDEEGWAIVTDFGIAKIADAKNLTASGAAVGTPAYMSPEQCSGKPLSGASDQYSLGIVAYEMLTGAQPFGGESIMEIMQQHFFEAPRPVEELRPDCPPALREVVARMLAKDPAARWPSLEQVTTSIGATPLAADDPVRTQMIELAKTGAAERLVTQIKTPRSPVPIGRLDGVGASAGNASDGAVAGAVDSGAVGAAAPSRLKSVLMVVPWIILAAVGASWLTANAGRLFGGDDPGAVSVTNTPPAAVIAVDGREQAGDSFQLPPGSYLLTVTAPGWEDFEERLDVAAGEAVTLAYAGEELTAPEPRPAEPANAARQPERADPPAGVAARAPVRPADRPAPPQTQPTAPPRPVAQAVLQIRVRPAAEIFINRASRGDHPRFTDSLIPDRSHEIRIVRAGYAPWDTIIAPQPGDTVSLNVVLREGGGTSP